MATALGAPSGVGARLGQDPRSERDRVRDEAAGVAAEVDVLEAEQAEVEAALDVLNENVDAHEADLEEAERAVAAAEDRLEQARADIVAAEEAHQRLEGRLVDMAVRAYTQPAGEDLASFLDSDDISEAVQRDALMQVRAGGDADLVDQVRALQEELTNRRQDAEDAAEEAEARRVEADEALTEVTAARDQQQAFAEDVQARIDEAVARAAELAAEDRELSARIANDAGRLQARVNAAPGGDVQSTSAAGGLCSAGGITVSCSISDRLASMISAAAADGVTLSGSGYRDPGRQVELRRQNCGGSSSAIYDASPGSCSPPTARPGSSQHEVGLAMDFDNCSSRSTACYQWLAGNAAGFGFYNLPSEPWHWSINGR